MEGIDEELKVRFERGAAARKRLNETNSIANEAFPGKTGSDLMDALSSCAREMFKIILLSMDPSEERASALDGIRGAVDLMAKALRDSMNNDN